MENNASKSLLHSCGLAVALRESKYESANAMSVTLNKMPHDSLV